MLFELYLIPDDVSARSRCVKRCTVTVPVVGFCVIVSDTLLQLELNTLLPLAKSNLPVKLPVVIV